MRMDGLQICVMLTGLKNLILSHHSYHPPTPRGYIGKNIFNEFMKLKVVVAMFEDYVYVEGIPDFV
ncbi:hypothetical protein U3516DRAFT_734101 [Neocallimastix sp. 'constans']